MRAMGEKGVQAKLAGLSVGNRPTYARYPFVNLAGCYLGRLRLRAGGDIEHERDHIVCTGSVVERGNGVAGGQAAMT